MSKDTTIANWLDANGWSRYQPGFDALQLEKLGDLGDQTDAKFLLQKAMTDAAASVIQNALDSWKAQVEDPKLTAQAPPARENPRPLPADATIPPGMSFDLSAPTITFSDIEFTVPRQLEMASNAQPPAQGALTPAQWMMLASQTFLTRGLDMSNAFDDKEVVSHRSPLLWKCSPPQFFTMPAGGARASSVVSFNSAYRGLWSQKMVAADLNGQYAFCSAAAAAQYNEKRAEATAAKRIYMRGWWRFPLAKVQIDKCTDLSPAFVDELSQALQLSDEDPARQLQRQYAALSEIFREYGQAVAKTVTLGGQAWFTSDTLASALVSQTSVEDVLKVAVNLSMQKNAEAPASGGTTSQSKPPDASAGGSATVALGDGHELKAETFSQEIIWQMDGGGRAVIGNNSEWLQQLANPSTWEVIRREDVTSIFDFIQLKNPLLADALQRVWKEARNAYWTGTAPPGFDDPAFAGKQVFIKNAMAVIGAYNAGATTDVVNAEFHGMYVPFPPIVPLQTLADPAGHHLLWQFAYAGIYDHDSGEPLYRVQTADGRWCMSVSRVIDIDSRRDWWTLSLQEVSQAKLADSANDASLWLLRDADPFNVLKAPFSNAWLLKNYATRLYLGDSALWDNHQLPGHDQTFLWRFCLHDLEAELAARKPFSLADNSSYTPSQGLVRACWTIQAD